MHSHSHTSVIFPAKFPHSGKSAGISETPCSFCQQNSRTAGNPREFYNFICFRANNRAVRENQRDFRSIMKRFRANNRATREKQREILTLSAVILSFHVTRDIM